MLISFVFFYMFSKEEANRNEMEGTVGPHPLLSREIKGEHMVELHVFPFHSFVYKLLNKDDKETHYSFLCHPITS